MSSIWGNTETQFFFELGPDEILRALDFLGMKTTGRVMQLNSMENRVYEAEIESKSDNPSDHFKIVKFYRPGRWSEAQIREEHEFLLDLDEFEIPVIAPEKFSSNEETLFKDERLNLLYTVFRKQGGRAPDEFNNEELEQIGRLLARVHNVGAMKKANHRLKLTPDTYVKNNLDYLLDSKKIPSHLEMSFKSTLEVIYNQTKNAFDNINYIRIHGDCHLGNVIRRESVFHLIDFDDFVMGPAIQDIWLLLPGRDEYTMNQRQILLNEAGISWKKMQSAANEAGIELIPYSGFRSIKLQRNLIKGQLRAGKNLDDILSRLAIPGFSEHHTGRAVDIISNDVIKLDETFEKTDAFNWLEKNAHNFNFVLSYPRNNPYGIIYEPWHWCFQEN